MILGEASHLRIVTNIHRYHTLVDPTLMLPTPMNNLVATVNSSMEETSSTPVDTEEIKEVSAANLPDSMRIANATQISSFNYKHQHN